MSEIDEYRDPDVPGADYRPVFRPAVVALIISIPGLISIAWPPALALNFIAAVVAFYSVVRIGDQSEFIGLKMAKAALLIALISGSFSVTYYGGRLWYLNRTAYEHSRVIADLIMNGRYAEAFEYSIDPPRRQPKGTNLVQYYAMPDRAAAPPPGLDVLVWKAEVPLSVMEEDDRNGALYFEGFGRYRITDFRATAVTCIYRYEPALPELQATTFQMVFVRKKFKEPLGVAWRLYLFDVLSGPQTEKKLLKIGGPAPSDDDKGADAGTGDQ